MNAAVKASVTACRSQASLDLEAEGQGTGEIRDFPKRQKGCRSSQLLTGPQDWRGTRAEGQFAGLPATSPVARGWDQGAWPSWTSGFQTGHLKQKWGDRTRSLTSKRSYLSPNFLGDLHPPSGACNNSCRGIPAIPFEGYGR